MPNPQQLKERIYALNPELKDKYCTICGRKLATKKYSLGFSETTGKEKFGTVLFCPKWKYAYLSHFTKSFDENGDEIIEYSY